ncbi:uncharacterized protein EAE98_008974 [Botrytis deweyae]|uniref:Reverse transcriptase domain-containing protein n=1 Tax=Botrytis deweyae TaxID=2478750 RepID=A0ABQ7ICM8_9HELO|nr:uncharacterized protein EAE98_008974 [Botrytis deweyae]KAF7920281.1 hypothetical protein EAE98_008974 [Botrytis deweyae]
MPESTFRKLNNIRYLILNNNLNKGFICKSYFRSTIPLLLIAKPKKGICIYQDYCELNNIIIKNRYSLLLIKETLNTLYYTKIYIKLNIITIFNKLRITKGYNLFEFLIIPFNLYNTSISFQNYINYILFNFLDRNYTIYLNNILIYFINITNYQKQIYKIIQKLINTDLQIDIEKYKFETIQTKYLKLIITPNRIEINPDKIKTILN